MSATLRPATLLAVFPSAVGRMFTIDPEDRSSGANRPLRIDAAANRAAMTERPPP
jgi:hypothetical protein